MMKMEKQKLLKIIEIICTAIISVATVVLIDSCTTSFNLIKAGNDQKVEQNTTNSADSTNVIIKPEL